VTQGRLIGSLEALNRCPRIPFGGKPLNNKKKGRNHDIARLPDTATDPGELGAAPMAYGKPPRSRLVLDEATRVVGHKQVQDIARQFEEIGPRRIEERKTNREIPISVIQDYWLAKHDKPKHDFVIVPAFVCKDGFHMSVQASAATTACHVELLTSG